MGNISYFKIFLAMLFANLAAALIIFIVSTMMWYFTGKAIFEAIGGSKTAYDTPHSRAKIAAQQQPSMPLQNTQTASNDSFNQILEKQRAQLAQAQRDRKEESKHIKLTWKCVTSGVTNITLINHNTTKK